MFLLDTNVISELRKSKTGKINPHVKRWAEGVLPIDLFLSVITLLELEMGIGLIERHDLAQAAFRDALIAATAIVHNMTVVTRNVADFKLTGVQLLNPWES